MYQSLKKDKFSLASVLMGICLTACQNSNTPLEVLESRNWCLSGGNFYTALDDNPKTDAIAVQDGKISYVAQGAAEENWCDKYAGPNPRVVNLAGKTLYPGLTDGHAHLIGIGLRELQFNLDHINSIEALKYAVKQVVEQTPKGEPIFGRGWIETHWPEKRFPTRYDLDEVSPDNPVILQRSDGHAMVANSLALKKAQITQSTPSPFGGDIRKLETGEPSGILVDNAVKLVEDLRPKMTPERREQAYIKASDVYASRGWTNIHSMSVDPDDIPLINRLAQDGKIKIRVYNSIDLLDGRKLPKMEMEKSLMHKLVTTRAIKLYADGALGSRGAALLAPYSDDADNLGLMTLKAETALPIMKAALRNGIQVNTHAIGDKANRNVLNWYKQALNEVPEKERAIAEPRWRIEHAQILNLEDLSEFVENGIIPSMQPSHAIGDLHFAVDRLGEERLKGGYAWQSLIDTGTIIAGGSDAPVEVGDPRIELYAATVRKDLKGFSQASWRPEEKVSTQNALKMFTLWPAIASFQEDSLGTISVGKSADFSIFSGDLFDPIAQNVLPVKTVLTIVDGNIAYEAKTP